MYGITLDNFMFLSFATFSLAVNQPGRVFGPAQLSSSAELAISYDDARAFFDIVGLPISDFRNKALNPSVHIDGYEPYCLSPLLKWPAIRLRNGAHSIPIPRLMLDRATIGTYYDFMPAAQGRFGNFWGNAFEAYVGQLMSSTSNVPDPVRAEDLVSGEQICDWVLIEPETILLIECKTRTLSARSRITGEEEDLRRDVTRIDEGDPEGSSLAKGVVQLMRTRDALEARDPGRYRYVCLLVTLDKIYLGNYTMGLHRFIREGAEAIYGDSLPKDFQVTDIAGFERLLQLVGSTGRSPFKVLEDKIRDPNARELDLMTYVGQIGTDHLEELPFLREASGMSMRELVEEFKI
jgi:hypothetical protein